MMMLQYICDMPEDYRFYLREHHPVQAFGLVLNALLSMRVAL